MKKHVFILSLFVIVFAACSYYQRKERRNIVAPPKVHRKYERKCDEKKVIEKDKLQETHKLQSLVEKDTSWYGHYEYYMQASDYPPIFVGYELEISPDSCIFTGNGQMTYFRILCTVSKKNENHLKLCYLASLGENNSLPLSNAEKVTVVELYRYNGKYYLKSPYIINKKGKNNVKVKCEKQQ